jgi:hypothetical protein
MLLFETQVTLRNYALFLTPRVRLVTVLNEHLLVGPKLQQDLPAIVARWRQWHYVYTADIVKMFHQILIEPMDADFQRIFWRLTLKSSLQHF